MGKEEAFPFYEDRILRIPPEAAPKTSGAVVASVYPDFCTRHGSVYGQDIMAFESADEEAVPDVLITGCPASNAGARLAESLPAGPGAGVSSGVVGGQCRPVGGMADNVLIHGAPTVRHTTDYLMNTAGPEGLHNTAGKMVYEGGGANDTSSDRGYLYGAGNAASDALMAPFYYARNKTDLAAWKGRQLVQLHAPLLELLPEPLGDAIALRPIRDALGIDSLVADVGELSSHPLLGELLPSADRGQAYIEGMAELLAGAQNDPVGTAEAMVLAGYRERADDGRPKEAAGYLGGQVVMTVAGGRTVVGKLRTPVRRKLGFKVTPTESKEVMKDARIDPDGYVYRTVPKEYLAYSWLSKRRGDIAGHDNPTARVADVHGPKVPNPQWYEGLPAGHGIPRLAPEHVYASDLSNPYGFNFAAHLESARAYSSQGAVTIRVRVRDIIDAGGVWYPDVEAKITGAVYVTTPYGTRLPFEVVPP